MNFLHSIFFLFAASAFLSEHMFIMIVFNFSISSFTLCIHLILVVKTLNATEDSRSRSLDRPRSSKREQTPEIFLRLFLILLEFYFISNSLMSLVINHNTKFSVLHVRLVLVSFQSTDLVFE